MTDDPRLQELLDELLDSHCTPEEVCGSCPELLPEIRERWRQMNRVQADLDALFPPLSAPSTSPPASPLEDTALPRIQGYEVETVLGRGGMGVVFRARHLRLGRTVALKMLLAGAYASPHERARFQCEAEVVAGLRHANIVQLYDVADHEGRPYFTMELVEGGNLAQKLPGTPQPACQAAALLATLAEAVQVAHEGGIVHRDLKPANVLLTADGTPKVSDFGLAQRLEGGASLTQTGVAIGTPSYMAPERALGRTDAVGPAVDIYALGAILYEMLTGRPPFRGETAVETVHQVIFQDPVPPSWLNSKVPRDLETICLKCLHKEPGRRYASAGALAADLKRFLEGRPVLARPMSRPERSWRWCRRHPWETALAGLTLLVILLIVGGAWWADRQRTKRQAEQALQEERARQGAKGSLEQARVMRRRARWVEAMNALEQAALFLGDDGPEDLRRQLEQSRRDLRMAETLDGISQAKATLTDGQFDPARVPPAYAQAFHSYGLAIRDESVAELAKGIGGSEIKQELLDALDDWIFLERSDLVGKLAAVASAADPASWRNQVRHAAVKRNVLALALLAETAPRAEQSMALLLALARRFSFTEEERLAIAFGGVSNLGFLSSPGGVGSVLAALARIAGLTDPVRCLRRLQKEHEDDFWVNFTLANAQVMKNPEEAVRYYQAALAIRKFSVAVHSNLGFTLTANGQADEAIHYLRRAAQVAPDSFVARDNLASALAMKGQIDEAIDQYRQVLRLAPRYARGWYHLGLALESKGRINDAIEHFRQALAIDSRIAVAQASLLNNLLLKGRADAAIAYFRQAVRNDPRDAQAHNHLGHALAAAGRLDEAIDHFQQALRINPEDARTHYNLGVGLFRKGRLEEALAQLRQAVAIDPEHAGTNEGLRALLIRLGRLEEARSAWHKALKSDPPGHKAWYGYAEFCLFLGQEDEYRQARRALLSKFATTTDPQVAERTARACLLLPTSGDELREAVSLSERAVAADRSKYQWAYPFFRFVQGLAEYRQGRFDEAIATMRGDAFGVLEPAPRLVLAMALHRHGRVVQARKTLAAAVWSHNWRASKVRDQDGWIYHVLRREAEKMILPGLPAFLEGKYQPQDNDERLALLGVCQFTNRVAALARLYAEAFVAVPLLAEDVRSGHRFNAARAAALAGWGRGKDGALLSEEEKARWRKQACAWLKLDLAAWTKTLNNGGPATRNLVRQTLTGWRADRDLAGLREPGALEKLSAPERNEWIGLWKEVAAVNERTKKGR